MFSVKFNQLFLLFFLYLVLPVSMNANHQVASDSLTLLLKYAKKDSVKCDLLHELAGLHFVTDNDKCLEYATAQKTLAAKIGYQTSLGLSYSNIGWVYLNWDDYPNAFKNLRTGLEVLEGTKDSLFMTGCLNGIGHAYLGQGNFAEALSYYYKSIKICEAIIGVEDCLPLQGHIANVKIKQGKYEEVLTYYLNEAKRDSINNDIKNLAYNCNELGNIYEKLGQYDAALSYNLKARKLANENGNIQIEAYSLAQLGSVFVQKKQYKKANDYLLQSLEIAKNNGFKQLHIEVLSNIGNAYTAQKKYNQAIFYYEEGLQLSKEIGSLDNISSNYENLHKIYSVKGDAAPALESYKQYIVYRDSVFGQKNTRKILLSEMQYKADKEALIKNIEIEKKQALAQKKIQQQKIIRNIFIGSFVVMLLFARLFFSQRNKINKEKIRSDELLLNIFPEEIAEEIKTTGTVVTQQYDNVTILFTDFVGFTKVAEKLPPEKLVQELDKRFKAFDKIVEKYNLEKIKTIGDSYMCAGGLPTHNNTHALDAVNAALEIQSYLKKEEEKFSDYNFNGLYEMRIGIHTGPVVAGIVGDKKFAYDIWGDAVNIAAGIERGGRARKVNISNVTYEKVKHDFECTHRGKIRIKNRGEVDMYFVKRK